MGHINIEISELSSCRIYYGQGALAEILPFIEIHRNSEPRWFLITDKNTHKKCLPILKSKLPVLTSEYIISPGEKSKNLQNAGLIWKWLLENNAGKGDLLINLGGGVVTDLGGFVASSFKRGIKYINIPTTLIGQADAAIGGKTALNLLESKNQVGGFYHPSAVFIDPVFLETLPKEHFRSGYTEILKCALLSGKEEWKSATETHWEVLHDWSSLTAMAVRLKSSIVEKDPKDQGIRKSLNFGHTLGHAFESLSLKKYPPGLFHGDAVALGMIGELYLSWRINGLCWNDMIEPARFIRSVFPVSPLSMNDYDEIFAFLLRDKKNEAGNILFSLLKGIGEANWDIACEPDIIRKAAEFIFNES